MEWWTGLALLPALMCGVMMGGMALMAALGLRRSGPTSHSDGFDPDQADREQVTQHHGGFGGFW